MRIAIIPIKHISERFPGKNFKILCGFPLYLWIIKVLQVVVDKILIETDSPTIESECASLNKVHVIMRPENICGHTVSTNKLINHILTLSDSEISKLGISRSEFDDSTFIQTHVTNPCLTAETLIDAFNFYHIGGSDSVFCVTKKQSRFYDNEFSPINHDPDHLIPTQQLKPLYEDNSCFYIFSKKSFMKHGNRISADSDYYVINNKWEAIDIDYEEDFELAEYWLLKQSREREKSLGKGIEKHQYTVLITGSAGGLGSELCRFFSEKEWDAVGTDLIGCDNTIGCDLSSPDQIDQLCDQLFGFKLDGVVLCAAFQECYTLCDTPLASWNKTFDINLRANYLLIKGLVNNGCLKSGSHITIIGSVHSWVTSPGIAAYSITKAALVNMTRVLAMELGPLNIIVNCLHPGAILTPMLLDGLARDYDGSTGLSKEEHVTAKLKNMAAKHPSGKILTPTDIARSVYFLTSPENTAFHGSNLIADGGVHVRLATE
jgi:NAD(P)-dependent dehydrogenase (short-subunit alcohol dehydrogenase family)/CMP-N-acetylneuraminic acid synthetase